MAYKVKVGSPWTDATNAVRDSILRVRALTEAERASRPSLAEWYAGRSVLVTGASGFLGRVLVEFLLRCCPDIQQIYVILRPKRGQDPVLRLQGLLDVPLFDRLRAEQPHALAKVVPVAGDMEATALGLSDDDRHRICDEVSVVFHVAASVRFDDPFRKAVFTNLRSSREVVTLAKAMPLLKSLVHVSTAYCFINQDPVEEIVYPTELDYRDVIRWAEELPDSDLQAVDFLDSKLRGFQPNTYTWTKAMAERLMEDAASELPIIITRPSIVVATKADPLPGWIDNLNGLGGFFAGGFSGVLRVAFVKERDMAYDTVPVDVAIKLILLASWSKGLGIRISQSPQGVDVVNVTIGRHLGLTYDEGAWTCSPEGCLYKVAYPSAIRTPHFSVTTSRFVYGLLGLYFHTMFGIVIDGLARVVNAKPRLLAIYRKMTVSLHATRAFQRNFTFIMENQERLQCMIHPQDERTLGSLDFYASRVNIDSLRTVCEDQIRGILLYALKEKADLNENLKHLNRIKWVSRVYNLIWILVATVFLWCIWALKRQRMPALTL